MPDLLTNFIDTVASNLPIIAIVIIVIIFLVWLFLRRNKQEGYKQIDLEKEVKKDLKQLFNLTKETIGYGKTLYIGSRNAGFILKSIIIPKYYDIEKNVAKTLDKELEKIQSKSDDKKYEVAAKYFYSKKIGELSKEEYENIERILVSKKVESSPNEKVISFLYGFETCGRGFFKRILANFFDFGIDYFLIDYNIIEEYENSFNISWKSKPVRELGVWLIGESSLVEIEEIAYKLKHTQHLEAMVNIIPRSTFISDIDHAKQKSSYDELEQYNREKRKEQLEQIKKA